MSWIPTFMMMQTINNSTDIIRRNREERERLPLHKYSYEQKAVDVVDSIEVDLSVSEFDVYLRSIEEDQLL